ncbi:MAG TPA: DciA family protein, partial [Acidimicrobiales bacterium]
IDRGVLTVRAGDPAWANQLQWLERDLLRRLEDALGPGVIRSIVVRTGTVSSRPNTRRQPRRRR